MKMRRFGAALVVLMAIAGFSPVIMLLWNAIIPSIFVGVNVINFWKALGLLALSRILFGGIGSNRILGRGRMHGGLFGGNPIRERWMKMDPEKDLQNCTTILFMDKGLCFRSHFIYTGSMSATFKRSRYK